MNGSYSSLCNCVNHLQLIWRLQTQHVAGLGCVLAFCNQLVVTNTLQSDCARNATCVVVCGALSIGLL